MEGVTAELYTGPELKADLAITRKPGFSSPDLILPIRILQSVGCWITLCAATIKLQSNAGSWGRLLPSSILQQVSLLPLCTSIIASVGTAWAYSALDRRHSACHSGQCAPFQHILALAQCRTTGSVAHPARQQRWRPDGYLMET